MWQTQVWNGETMRNVSPRQVEKLSKEGVTFDIRLGADGPIIQGGRIKSHTPSWKTVVVGHGRTEHVFKYRNAYRRFALRGMFNSYLVPRENGNAQSERTPKVEQSEGIAA